RLRDFEPVGLEVAANDAADPVFVVDDEHPLAHASSVRLGSTNPPMTFTRPSWTRTPRLHADAVVSCMDPPPRRVHWRTPTMQRRTAVAAASAVSVSLVSAVLFGAASLGVLSFAARSSTPPSATPVTAPAAQPSSQVVAAPSASHPREHEGSSASPSAPAPARQGGHDD